MKQTYEEFITNILNTRGRHGCGDEYHEEHHIIPKCIGGLDDKDNLIDLYAREHFIAHKLLAQENPTHIGLVSAYSTMAFMKNGKQQRCEITPEEYELARISFSNAMKSRWEDEEYRNAQIEILHQRWEDPEYRRKQSESRTRLNFEMWSDPKFKEIMGQKVKDRWANASDEFLQKQKDNMQAISNELWKDIEYIKKHCDPVFCIETEEYFFKQQDAIQKYNINSTGICNYLKGRQKSAGKHPITKEPLHWRSVTWEEYTANVSDICRINEANLLKYNEF